MQHVGEETDSSSGMPHPSPLEAHTQTGAETDARAPTASVSKESRAQADGPTSSARACKVYDDVNINLQ